MGEQLRCDVAIIGGGPGGYATALRAAELKQHVIVIERDKIGGTCLHNGCVPTTSLLYCASVLENAKRSDKFGIKVENISYDWQAVQKTKQNSVNRLYMGLNTLFKQRKVDVIKGNATLNEPGIVKIEDGDVEAVIADNIVIASGSSPQTIPRLAENPNAIIDTSGALDIHEIPESITIIGAGAYGIEFASLFRSFGSKVSIIETAPRLAPRDDEEISRYLKRAFKKRGIDIYTGSKFTGFTGYNGGVEIEFTENGAKRTIVSDKVLATVGKTANTNSIDKEALDITTKDGFIVTGADMKSGTEGIYAVGDVTYNPQYANFAFQEGIYVAETIAGLKPPPLNLKQIPIYTFGYPELAKVGYSEQEARDEGLDVETASIPFQAVSRSAIEREDIGFAKIVALKNGTIIGIHLVGPSVINLIAEAMLITNWEATALDVAGFLHPHPTFAESIGEAALKLAGKPLHSL